jgi:hypothetical protein
MRFFTAFRLLLLGLWIGAAVYFVVVAQSAFEMMPSHDLAGNLVGRILAVLNYSGLGIAFVAFLTSLIVPAGTNIMSLWLERIMLVIFGLGCAANQFVIGFSMLMLKTQMGKPIDEVAADDPLRIQFNQLHEYSTWVMIAAMSAAFLSFVIISLRRQSAVKKAIDPLDFQKQFKI